MAISPLQLKRLKETIIPVLIEEYYSLLCIERKDVSRKDLFLLANSAFKNAVSSFRKLKSPRICSDISTYTSYWLREELNKFFQTKTLRKINIQNTADEKTQYLQALKDFFSVLSLDLLKATGRQLWGAKSFEERKRIYRQYKSTLDTLKTPFMKLVKSRNIIAKGKGYFDYPSFIKAEDRIPNEEFNRFLVNIDEVIYYFYSNLPKVRNRPEWFYDRLNFPCLLCLVSYGGPESLVDVVNYVTRLYPQLKLFLSKVNLLYGERSYMRYVKERDGFEIAISKDENQRHQMVSLVHELGHVIYFLDRFECNENVIESGKYVAEKAAIKIQLGILGSLHSQILQAHYMGLLLIIRRTLFELAIYSEPKQNYDLLYAHFFNKCFPGASQRRNPLYLLDESVIIRPLTSLPSAIASTNVILENKVR